MVVNKIFEVIRFVWLHLLMLSLVCMNCQFAYAGTTAIIPDSSVIGNKVFMDTAANGIPIVNINNPNSAGISHNRFTEYNVGNRGAIINNSKNKAKSILGGVVLGNANLQVSARAIINEVTGTRRSHINGTQEIFGARADYILANPNGISVNGGDFINTHKAMLTTGRVILDASGNLEKLLIEKGNVEILGRELNISNLDYFDIIARTTRINTKIHAGREARIITGKGEFNAKDQSFKSKKATGTVPGISIDSSHLGGLYAGRIALISNEDGVGVNLPDMASRSGNIEITSSGRIVHKNISSASSVKVESRDSGIISSASTKADAKGDVTYHGKTGIEVADKAIINATGTVKLDSKSGVITNKGKVVADRSGGIEVAGQSFQNHGDVYAKGGGINIVSASDIFNSGKISAVGKLVAGYKDNFINSGLLTSKAGIDVLGGQSFRNRQGGRIKALHDITAKSSMQIINEGLIMSDNLTISSIDSGINNRGNIFAAKQLNISVKGNIYNKGNIINDKDIINADHDDLTKYHNPGMSQNMHSQEEDFIVDIIASDPELSLKAQEGILENKGLIYSSGNITIETGDSINNLSGRIIGNKDLKLTSVNAGLNNIDGIIKAQGELLIETSDEFTNKGDIGAGGTLVISSGDAIKNYGLILGQDVTTLQALGNIENIDIGKIEAHGDLTITSQAGKVISINNDPAACEDSGISAFANLVIKSALGVDNIDSHIESKGNMQIASAGSFDNRGGAVLAGGRLDLLINGAVSNTAIMQAGDKLLLRGLQPETVAGSLTNSGLISSEADLDFSLETDTQNSGIIRARDAIKLTVNTGGFTNTGVIFSQLQDIELVSRGDITIKDTGVFDAAKSVTLTSNQGQISNAGKIFSADAGVSMHAEGDIKNEGTVIAKDAMFIISDRGGIENVSGKASIVSLGSNVTINADGEITSSGLLQAKEALGISSRAKNFHNDGGKVIAGDILKIKAMDIINNRDADSSDGSGYLQAGKLLELVASGQITNAGVINALDAGIITAETDIINSGNIQINRGVLISLAGNVENNKLVSSSADLKLIAAKDISNRGDIDAADLTLTARTRIDNQSQIKVAANFTVADTQTLENSGLIEFRQMLANVGVGNVDNKEGATLRGGDLIVKADSFTNAGQTHLGGILDLDAGNMTTNILVVQGKSDIRIKNNFINIGKLHALGSILTLTAKSVTNKGEFKAGKFNATTTEGTFDNQGMIFGSHVIDINAPGGITNSHYIISGGTTTLKTGKTLTNSKGIYGAGSVTVSAKSLSNSGVINSSGSVAITAGSTDNRGTLAGRNSLVINGALTNRGTVVSDSSLTVNAGNGSIYNTGYITSHGNARLGSSTLSNYGTLQAVGTLTTNQAGDIGNSGSIYGGVIDLRAGGTVSNEDRIIARNGLTIAAGGDVRNKQEISLLGAGVLSITARNIRNDREYRQHYQIINPDELKEKSPMFRKKPNVSWGVYSEYDDWDWFDGTIDEYKADKIERNIKELITPGPGSRWWEALNRNPYYFIRHKFEYHDKKLSDIAAIQPQITSGGTINLTAGVGHINNTTGLIQATSHITLTGGGLINADIVQKKYTLIAENKRTARWVTIDKSSGWGTKDKLIDIFTAKPLYFDPDSAKEISRIPSLIQAGGAITGTLAGSVTNGSASSGGSRNPALAASAVGHAAAGNYAVTGKEPADITAADASYEARFKTIDSQKLKADNSALSQATVAATHPVKPSAIELSLQRSKARDRSDSSEASEPARVSMQDADLGKLAEDLAKTYEASSDSHKPLGFDVSWESDNAEIMAALRDSDWNKPTAPGHYYITETSPVFTDVEKYFSTDNFIRRIEGFDPKKQHLHYGDAMKQMDLVRRQRVELTGLGSLDDHLDSTEQMRKLYESGIKYGKELKLTAGVTLTKEQVDQLQDDMVWAEEMVLDGSKVIIPKLYVAGSKRSKQAGGMLAQTIDIEAGSISNTSSIVGGTVSLTARDGDIINSDGGEIYAGEHLRLSSAGNITNIGSTIVSDGSGVMLAGGNIENITESEHIGDDRNHFTIVADKAGIQVSGVLELKSLGDLINHGALIESGDFHFEVEGNLSNESITVASGMENSGDNYHYRQSSVSYRPGTITAAGDIAGLVSGDFSLIGSRMSAGGDSTIAVGGNSHLISQVASESVDSHSSSKTTNALGGTSKSSHSHQSRTETLVASSLSAGGKNVLINGRDQVLYGAKISGNKGVRLKGRKTSILASRLDNYNSTNNYDKGMVLEETESFGDSSTSHVHSTLSVKDGAPVKVESESLSVDYKQEKSGGFFSPRVTTDHKPAWARQLEFDAHTQVRWNPLQDSSDSWYESDTRLTPEASAVVSIAAAVGTMWAGGFGLFAAPATATAGATAAGATAAVGTTAAAVGTTATVTTASMMSTMGTVMLQAGATSLASSSAVSLINNDFDLGKVASDLTTPAALKGLGISMLASGLTAGIGHRLELGQLAPGMNIAERGKILAQQGVIGGAVSTGLAGISGERVEKAWRGEALSGALALGQSVVGDFAAQTGDDNSPRLENGSVGKIALHAATGGVYSIATGGDVTAGIIGGVVGEVVPTLMESAAGETGPPAGLHLPTYQTSGRVKAITQLAAATSMLLVGGSASDISSSGSVALSVIENNLEKHQIETLQMLEYMGYVEPGTTLEAIEQAHRANILALDVGSDIASLATMGPSGVVAKNAVVHSIKGVAKKLANLLSAKVAKVEKISGSVGGKVIEHVPQEAIISTVIRPATKVKSGVTLQLKQKPGESQVGFNRKVDALQQLAKQGKLQKAKPAKRNSKLLAKHRRELNDRIDMQYGKQNPEFAVKAKAWVKKSDMDHVHELQLGGEDIAGNLRALLKPPNRSIGRQIQHQIKDLPIGTKIDSVIIKKK